MRTALLKVLALEVKRKGNGGTPSTRLAAAKRVWKLTKEEGDKLKELAK